MRRLKKVLLRVLLTLSIVVVLVFIFISPITKYLVEKYDEKYTGRQITMDWAYVNPFTGYIHFDAVTFYEADTDSVFFTAAGISANIAMFKLFSGNWEIGEITLDHPRGIIIQEDKVFNISDLIEKFTSDKQADTTGKPLQLNLLGIKIIEGEFHFREKLIPINYFIKNVNIESPGKYWNSDTLALTFAFLPGTGTGDMKGNGSLNFKNLDYRLAAVAHHFDLDIIRQYLKDLTNYGSFRANLDADLRATGNFRDRENITAAGTFAVNDFHFGKSPEEDFASFEKLEVSIQQVISEKKIYRFDSISLNHPFFKYERYDHLDNLQMMFGAGGSNISAAQGGSKFNLVIEIADYIKVLVKNLFRSDYKIDRLAIYKADIQYADYTLSEKFAITLNPLTATADSVDKSHNRVRMKLHSGMLPYGQVTVALSMNPRDSSDFELHYHLQQLPVSLFNPYIISYTSLPLDRGTIEVKGTWRVQNGAITSTNHLLIIDPRVSTRIKNKGTRWLPLRLVMAFIRERGNVIDYEIPISGNLNDPKFHWRDVIYNVLRNIFIKPVTTPYGVEVRNVEMEIERSLTLKWEMNDHTITKIQQRFIKKMVVFLQENPEARISVSPLNYTLKEKEYILLYKAKKKYYLTRTGKPAADFREKDSVNVQKMDIKDSLFIHYLNRQTGDPMLNTVQDKCMRIIGTAAVDTHYNTLNQLRAAAFISLFREGNVAKQVNVLAGKSVIPYNGFSLFRIDYNGEFPEYLLDAYREMSDLNNESPREEFKKARDQNKR